MRRFTCAPLGREPLRYARKVLEDNGLGRPPVSIRAITDALGISVIEYSLDGFEGDPVLREAVEKVPACLVRSGGGSGRIRVFRDVQRERKRLSIAHECGHAILPWHLDLNYMCEDRDVGGLVHIGSEREAFNCAAEFLMSREIFVQDVMSLPIGFAAIDRLADRYQVSREATAIQYVYTHPGLCGLLMVEPAPKREPPAEQKSRRQPPLFPMPRTRRKRPREPRKPLRVRYSVRSRRFPGRIPSGQRIGACNLVHESWTTGLELQGEISVASLGVDARWVCNVECRPIPSTRNVIVLLWLPDTQERLDEECGEYL